VGVFESLLNNTFSVSRPTRVSDGQGGWALVPVAMGDVEGRMRPASGAEIEVAALQQREITHVLYVVAADDVRRGDQVTGDGATWDVLGVREPSRADHHLEIDCRQLLQEGATP
jgi:SPP1 family predicted phage head-tail adaptor